MSSNQQGYCMYVCVCVWLCGFVWLCVLCVWGLSVDCVWVVWVFLTVHADPVLESLASRTPVDWVNSSSRMVILPWVSGRAWNVSLCV